MPRFTLGLFSLLLLGFTLSTLSGVSQKKKGRKIQILGADDLIYEESGGIKAKKLIGNVRIKHGSSLMKCDSAIVFNKTNTMKAYGHVNVSDDDMEITGDSLKYYGNRKLAEVRGKEVVLTQEGMKLTTQFINFDRTRKLGYYWGGGNVLFNDQKDSLYSGKGYYHTDSKSMEFKDSVRLRTKDYTIKSDTLQYNSYTEISHFFGPTWIESDSDLIYTEKGWSDNKNGISVFTTNAYVITADQELHGDSIYFDKKADIGKVYGNVKAIDTANQFMVEGDYLYLNQKDSTSLVLGDPLLTQFYKTDSLYLHADTIYSHFDSTRQFRVIHAYPEAQFYKTDLQGKSDSLVFSDQDSSIRLFYSPIIWSEENQITAKNITIFRKKDEIDRMNMDFRSFIITLDDTTGQYRKYNQIKGDSMIGYFKNNELNTVDVLHRGKTIYFAKDEAGDYLGMNKAECEFMTITLDSSAVKSIMFKEMPTAVLYPIKDVTPRMQFLKRFKWRENERPLSREDVFNWKEEEEPEGEN